MIKKYPNVVAIPDSKNKERFIENLITSLNFIHFILHSKNYYFIRIFFYNQFIFTFYNILIIFLHSSFYLFNNFIF